MSLQSLFALHAAVRHQTEAGPAWTPMELLREGNRDRLPTGEPWPDAFGTGPAWSR